MFSRTLTVVACGLLILFATISANAAPKNWQGQSSLSWDGFLNWSPFGAPVPSDNVLVGALALGAGDATVLDTDYLIDTLAISAASSVSTNGSVLNVTNDVVVSEASSKMIVLPKASDPNAFSFLANDVALLAGATLETDEGRTALDGNLTINAGAEITGSGIARPVLLFNDGDITATSSTVNLQIISTDPIALDIDGSSESGVLNATGGATLVISGELRDDFDGIANIGPNSRLSFFQNATIGTGGLVYLHGAMNEPAELVGPSGAPIINFNGTLSVEAEARVDSVQFLSGSKITFDAASDVLIVNGPDSLIDAGVTFSGVGTMIGTGSGFVLGDGAQVTVPVGLTLSGRLKIEEDAAGFAELLSLNMTSGSTDLEFELGGTALSEYDRLFVQNSTTITGGLEVKLIDGFSPTAGDAFQLISTIGTPISGTFIDTLNVLPTIGAGLEWQIDYSNSDFVFLRVQLPGDYNDNGVVDAADYTIWRDTFGSTTDLRADGNQDGVVNQSDYIFWEFRFGNTAPSNSTAVPEPTSVLIAALALAALPQRKPRNE